MRAGFAALKPWRKGLTEPPALRANPLLRTTASAFGRCRRSGRVPGWAALNRGASARESDRDIPHSMLHSREQ